MPDVVIIPTYHDIMKFSPLLFAGWCPAAILCDPTGDRTQLIKRKLFKQQFIEQQSIERRLIKITSDQNMAKNFQRNKENLL